MPLSNKELAIQRRASNLDSFPALLPPFVRRFERSWKDNDLLLAALDVERDLHAGRRSSRLIRRRRFCGQYGARSSMMGRAGSSPLPRRRPLAAADGADCALGIDAALEPWASSSQNFRRLRGLGADTPCSNCWAGAEKEERRMRRPGMRSSTGPPSGSPSKISRAFLIISSTG